MGVSFRPSDTIKGGGIEPGRYGWSNARFARYTYPGTANETLALVADLTDPDGRVQEQAWSIGSLDDFEPSPDGQEIVRIGRREGISDGCNFAAFNVTLVNRGYPENRFSNKAGETYNGLVCVLVPREHKRTGTLKPGMKETYQVVECEEILTLPWEAKDTGAGGAVAGGTRSNGAGSAEDVSQLLTDLAQEVIPDGEGGMAVAVFRTKVYQKYADPGIRKAAQDLLNNADWLDGLAEVNIVRDGAKLVKVA